MSSSENDFAPSRTCTKSTVESNLNVAVMGVAILTGRAKQPRVTVPAATAKCDFVFALNTNGGKSMWLQALKNEEMEQWIHAIQSALGVA